MESPRDAAFLATLLRVDGRHTWTSALHPTVVARRLWARFEFLPFRYGMALGAGVVVLAGVLVLAVTLDGDGSGKAPVSAGRPGRRPAEAAAPPAPTWGAYVPPRKARPGTVTARPRTVFASPRVKPTHASPRPAVTCPPTLRKWTWLWEMCRRKQNG
jgi:hypothetical protein